MSEKLSEQLYTLAEALRTTNRARGIAIAHIARKVAALEQQLAEKDAEIARLRDDALAHIESLESQQPNTAPEKCGICGKVKDASVHVKYGNDLEAIGVKHFYQAPEVK